MLIHLCQWKWLVHGIQRHLKDFITCLKEIPLKLFLGWWYVSLHVPTVSGPRGMHTVFILFEAVYFLDWLFLTLRQNTPGAKPTINTKSAWEGGTYRGVSDQNAFTRVLWQHKTLFSLIIVFVGLGNSHNSTLVFIFLPDENYTATLGFLFCVGCQKSQNYVQYSITTNISA